MEITLEKIELVKDRTGVTYAEAKKALLARIEEGKAKGYINEMGEVKRQLRCKLGPVEGKKIADAVDKLW